MCVYLPPSDSFSVAFVYQSSLTYSSSSPSLGPTLWVSFTVCYKSPQCKLYVIIITVEIISVGNQFGLLQKQSLRPGLQAGGRGGGKLILEGWSEATSD